MAHKGQNDLAHPQILDHKAYSSHRAFGIVNASADMALADSAMAGFFPSSLRLMALF